MAVSDFLSTIGKGIEATGRVAGTIGSKVAEGLVNEESGQAPEIAKEKRQHQQSLEDAALEAKSRELENQLEIGRKYGTLSADDQQKYVDAITNLYSHPRHAGTLMEKLRKAVHPNGATYNPGALSTLKNAVPEGGTAAADEANKEKELKARDEEARKRNPKLAALDNFTQSNFGTAYADSTPEQQEKALQSYVRASTKGSVGKSPPLTGNMLPPDAVGPDGQPIGQAGRDASHSFVEYNGSWWPVAKPKPVFKTVKGHSVLVDAQSGAILRDLGPTGTSKVTTRQTLQPGDDGQMHLVTLTSITAPGGETIEVDPQQSEEPPEQPKGQTPAKKVGSILPKTQAKPVTQKPGGTSPGKVVPGLSTLAKSKFPEYKADVASYKKVADDANAKNEAYENARKAIASGATASSDQELIYSWVRSNVQGAGRMTQAEFKQAQAVGSLPQKAQNWLSLASTGKLTDDIRNMMFADIKRSAETSATEAKRLRDSLGGQDSGGGRPAGAVGTVTYQGKKYWVDKDRNNLGEAQ